jgi:hypothetical protein
MPATNTLAAYKTPFVLLQKKKKPRSLEVSFFLGRNTRIELVHGRFTAGCVKPLHQFRQRVLV